MIILYFTSTGNSLLVAKRIGGEMYSIVQEEKLNNYTFSDETIGIVFPVYGLCVPPYIRKFLDKVKLDCKYLFSVITYGVHQGAVVSDLVELGDYQGLHFDYINTISMTESFIPKYEMEKQFKIYSNSVFEQNLQIIISEINSRKRYIRHDSLWEKFLTGAHKKMYPFPIGKGETQNFHVEQSCNCCGICEQVCPMNNVKLTKGILEFGNQCISCLACTQNCPQNAIRMTNEKSKARYRNPEVKLSEIVSANSNVKSE